MDRSGLALLLLLPVCLGDMGGFNVSRHAEPSVGGEPAGGLRWAKILQSLYRTEDHFVIKGHTVKSLPGAKCKHFTFLYLLFGEYRHLYVDWPTSFVFFAP